MSTRCFAPMLGKRIRVTTLDECGALPAVGTPNAVLSTDGFISVNLSAEVEDGVEIITKKADGTLCVNEKRANSFKRFNVEMELCGVNPSLLSMTTNAEVYLDWASNAAGFTVPEGTIAKWFALELWTGISGAVCVPGSESASGYMLLPFVAGGVLGDLTIDGENAVSFTLTGAYTKGGNGWGVGPFDVLATTGSAAEVQRLTITGTPTGGTFTLTLNGQSTTAQAYNVPAATLQTALLALTNLDTGDVVVTGGPGPGTPYTFTFGGAYVGENVPEMTVAHALTGGTTPNAAITTITQGAGSTAGALPTALDPFDHLLLIDTSIAPPPSACDPIAMPA